MQVDILTLFPGMFRGPFDESIVARARDASLVSLALHNLRDWAIDSRGTVDSPPYGGGAGMLLRPEPIFDAVADIKSQSKVAASRRRVVLLDAGGTPYTQSVASSFSRLDQIILVCGHYEGVDYRVHEHLADEVISIGDYVLTGGEIPAMVVVDSVVRLIQGVLRKEEAVHIESFSSRLSTIKPQTSEGNRQPETENRKLLEYPQYTRPEIYRGHKVPDVLLSGNHAEIEKWRRIESQKRTRKRKKIYSS